MNHALFLCIMSAADMRSCLDCSHMAKGNGTKEGHMRILVAEDERDMEPSDNQDP